jgi:hypothetical protein
VGWAGHPGKWWRRLRDDLALTGRKRRVVGRGAKGTRTWQGEGSGKQGAGWVDCEGGVLARLAHGTRDGAVGQHTCGGCKAGGSQRPGVVV